MSKQDRLARKFFVSISIALLVTWLTSCGGASDGNPQSTAPRKQADRLVYPLYVDIKDWDPATAFSSELIVLLNVYETLLRYDGSVAGGRVVPGLAEKWSRSKDGLSWLFQLRHGVSFHDGEPFNAIAAKQSIERTQRLAQGAAYIWDAVDAIDVVSEYELKITTKVPAPIDLIAASQYGAWMVSPKAAALGPSWFAEGRSAGTGPWQVVDWQRGQQVSLRRFDNYRQGWHDRQFREISMPVVSEVATQLQMLRAGEADFVAPAPVTMLDSLRKLDSVTVSLIPSWTNQQFLLNTSRYPTDNLKFRQAIMHAWDYKSVVQGVLENTADIAHGPIPPGIWGRASDLPIPEFNLDRAAQLLVASGIPKEDWRLKAAYVGSSQEYAHALLLLQYNLGKLGVDLELRPGPWGVIWDEARRLSAAPHLQSMTWWPTYPTPSDWLVGLFRTQSQPLFNLSHYSNPAFDRLVDEGREMEGSDREAAAQRYRQAQKILAEDAVAVFYADLKARLVHRSEIVGLKPNPAYAAVEFYSLRYTSNDPSFSADESDHDG